jgi:CRP-like cAMP-binding protein
MTTVDDFENLSFFDGLTAADRESLVAISERRSYAAGATIFAEGDGPGSLRVLVSGLVSLRQKLKGASGDAQMAAVSEPGSIFGIAALVGEEHLYPHSAVALEATEVIEIEADRLLELFDADPAAGVRILLRFSQYMAAKLSAAREQIRSRLRPGLISHG